MPAQVIFGVKKVLDQEALVAYRQLAHATIGEHQGRIVSGFGGMKALEGDDFVAMVIVEFPTREAAEAWYASPGYQQASQLRRRGADCAVTLVSW